jgi:thiamine-phosphate pyrophosphorylase
MIQFLTNYSENYQHKLEDIVEQVLDAGIDCIQFSWNRADAEHRIENVKTLVDQYEAKLCVNNNLDLALKYNADFIHVGSYDTSISDIRSRDKFIKIGYSIQPGEDVKSDPEINYYGVGPVFQSQTYTKHNKTTSVNRLEDIVRSTNKPICARGGINIENIRDISASGCRDICIGGAIYRSNNCLKTARYIVKYWNDRGSIS